MDPTTTGFDARRWWAIALALGLAFALLGVAPQAESAGLPTEAPTGERWQVDGDVHAALAVGSTVYLGGSFNNAIGPDGRRVPRKNLAAFDMLTGALKVEFDPVVGSSVRSLAADGTGLFIGGNFGRVNGVDRPYLAKVDLRSGAVITAFDPRPDEAVLAMAVAGDSLYIGGGFLRIGEINRTRFAKIDAITGEPDRRFIANVNKKIHALAKHPGSDQVYAVGEFQTVNKIPREGVAAVDAVTGNVDEIVFENAARPSFGAVLNEDGTRLFVAGGSITNATAAFDTATGKREWRIIADGDHQAIAYHAGTVYFGFHDGYHGDVDLKLLAADARTGTVDPTFRPVFDGFWGVFAVAANEHGVVAGGRFSQVDGRPANGFVRFAASQTPNQPAYQAVQVLGPNTLWSYWDRGGRPAGWAAADFDSSSWPRGTPRLGYGDDFTDTIIGYGPSADDKYITAYFRAPFELADAPDALEFQASFDDGAVFYLNGTEFARLNMPEGVITENTLALTDVNGADETAMHPLVIPVELLRQGRNWIAVEVHQFGRRSVDLGFDADLRALYGEVPSTEDPIEPGEPLDPKEPEEPGQPEGPEQPSGPGTGDVDQVIASDSRWRWRYEPAAPPSHWRTNGFDDSGWNRGAAILGWGHPSVVTRIDTAYADPNSRPRTAYFRQQFTVTGTADVTDVTVRTVANDGVIVYLNGTEVGRRNMTDAAGDRFGHDAYAVAPAPRADDAESVPLVMRVSPDLLVEGVNTIAVETHVAYRATPDVTFRLTATLARSGASPDPSTPGTPAEPDEPEQPGSPGEPEEPPAPTDPSSHEAISKSDSWRWWFRAAAPPPQWNQIGFDASAWDEGRAPLGWGASSVVTNIDGYAHPNDRPRVAYFRHTLDVAKKSEVASLRLTTIGNDGVVVYVNGTEVGRQNMEDRSATHATYAVAPAPRAEAAEASPLIIDVPVRLLVEGTNVIAAQSHVNYRATPDLTFHLTAVLTTDTGDVVENRPPTAAFSHVADGRRVMFDAADAADPDGMVVDYAWDFGDGTHGAGVVASHTYGAPGEYPVRLTVTDDQGATAVATRTVRVISDVRRAEVVAADATWRWWYRADAPPATWWDNGFDDSSWAKGQAVFGWGHESVRTTIDTAFATASQRPLTAYYRTTFDVDDTSSVVRLLLETVGNDGVIVFVNGEEVGRQNMGDRAPGHNVYAVAPPPRVAAAEANPLMIDVPITLLRNGRNTIAAESHVNYRATPDMTFHLAATLTTAP